MGEGNIDFAKFDILKWGAFKIPAVALVAASLLLLFRQQDSALEYAFIQSIVKYAIGASVISYGQSLFFTNFRLLKEAPDLPLWMQVCFFLGHIGWFGYWLVRMSSL